MKQKIKRRENNRVVWLIKKGTGNEIIKRNREKKLFYF